MLEREKARPKERGETMDHDDFPKLKREIGTNSLTEKKKNLPRTE